MSRAPAKKTQLYRVCCGIIHQVQALNNRVHTQCSKVPNLGFTQLTTGVPLWGAKCPHNLYLYINNIPHIYVYLKTACLLPEMDVRITLLDFRGPLVALIDTLNLCIHAVLALNGLTTSLPNKINFAPIETEIFLLKKNWKNYIS